MAIFKMIQPSLYEKRLRAKYKGIILVEASLHRMFDLDIQIYVLFDGCMKLCIV